jgi:hypothetical protein
MIIFDGYSVACRSLAHLYASGADPGQRGTLLEENIIIPKKKPRNPIQEDCAVCYGGLL